MKKLSKLSIFDECMNPELSESEMRETVGGYGGTNDCFFDCMAYITEQFGGDNTSPSYFMNDYVNGAGNLNDNWEGTKVPGDGLYGPPIFDKSGALNGDIANYMSNYFEIRPGVGDGQKILIFSLYLMTKKQEVVLLWELIV